MINFRRSALPSLALAAALTGATGCVETAVYEKTATQLDAAARASTQKDQQIRGLEWQVAVLAQQVREAEQRAAAAQRDLAAQVKDLTAANAALTERLRRSDEERQRLAAALAAEDAAGPGKRGRPDDVRRAITALDAQSTRILERLGRLEQKIDARVGEDRGNPKQRQRRVEADVVDPWGF